MFLKANKVVREQFGKSLSSIFNFYLDLADKRRNRLVTAEKMRLKELRTLTNADTTELSLRRTQSLQQLQDQVKAQKKVIGYKEYIQFCHDFNLKSTSLLTAVQVGEVFLNLVPLNSDFKAESGLSLDLFLRALVYLAFVAYRDVPSSVSPENKVSEIYNVRSFITN
jgi:hypothetical protein